MNRGDRATCARKSDTRPLPVLPGALRAARAAQVVLQLARTLALVAQPQAAWQAAQEASLLVLAQVASQLALARVASREPRAHRRNRESTSQPGVRVVAATAASANRRRNRSSAVWVAQPLAASRVLVVKLALVEPEPQVEAAAQDAPLAASLVARVVCPSAQRFRWFAQQQ